MVKPSRSRVVNSEKYLVCLGRCEDDAVFSRVVSLLERFHGMCTQNLSPLAVVPVSLMMGDGEFVKKVTAMNQTIAEKQTKVCVPFLLSFLVSIYILNRLLYCINMKYSLSLKTNLFLLFIFLFLRPWRLFTKWLMSI